MLNVENKNKDQEVLEDDQLDDEELEKVSGGGAFSDIPRVPVHQIDDDLKEKI